MFKVLVLSFTLLCTNKISYSQNCPYRIGDYVLNDSKYSTIVSHCELCDAMTINSTEEYQSTEVDYQTFKDDEYGDEQIYTLRPDMNKVDGWYNSLCAGWNPSVKSLFIPNYKTNDVTIKNLLLRFYDDTLYYMQGNITDSYVDVLLDKYKGQIHKVKDSVIKSECSRLPKKIGKYIQYVMYDSSDASIYSKLTLLYYTSKFCNVWGSCTIEIYNPFFTKLYWDEYAEDVKRAKTARDEKLKQEKEEKLNRF